jgi:hypothetical protein
MNRGASRPKLTVDQKREAMWREAGEPLAEIGRSYNVSHSTIQASENGGIGWMVVWKVTVRVTGLLSACKFVWTSRRSGRGDHRAVESSLANSHEGRALTRSLKHRAKVAFEAHECPERRLFIRMVVRREGKPHPSIGMFTFDPALDLMLHENELLVQALNRCITHLGMATPDKDAAEEETLDG